MSSWVLHQRADFHFVLKGPAIHIFSKKLGKLKNLSLEYAIEKSDWVICGSSWQSELERKAIYICKNITKRVVVFLDHWINYKERFQFMNKLILPNEIWVGDDIAYNIAKKTFQSSPITLIQNYYLSDIVEKIKNRVNLKKQENSDRILYVCEPVREHALINYGDEFYWGYSEEDALIFFLKNSFLISEKIKKIKVRPHPSENINKYKWLKEYSDSIYLSNRSDSLDKDISEADIIVGCESMAMVVGLLAGKRVISCIPPEGKKCGLPHKKIEHLKDKIICRQ